MRSPGNNRLLRAALGAALSFTAAAETSDVHGQATSTTPTILSMVPSTPNPALPLPAELVPQVEFWKAIYSRVGKDQVLFHDRNRLDVVYGLMNVPEALTPAAEEFNDRFLEARRDQYRSVLKALAGGFRADTLVGEARRIHDIWGRGATPGAFAEAAENVRWQRGLRERFIEGIAYSGRYQPHVEQVFREEGVPLELTFLPFVESMYNVRAYSSVGAAGIWQFMPGTGRLFMRVDRTLDERMDPIRAARGAARLLRRNYEELGTWPLAITAYNHGPAGMKRAVRTMGTRDISRIVRFYDGPSFGFASRNFYTEFLAALEVRRNHRRYFGDVRMDPPLSFDEIRLPAAMRLSALADVLDLPVEALWDMNPAVTANARRQDRPVPAGYALRLPQGFLDDWGEVLEDFSERRLGERGGRASSVLYDPRADDDDEDDDGGKYEEDGGRAVDAPVQRWHVVRRGDTLGKIAQRYGVSVRAVRHANGLSPIALIRPGQRLRIPG